MKSITLFIFTCFLFLISCSNNQKGAIDQQTSQEVKTTETSQKVKIDIFNNINKTKDVLSLNGIGQLHDWKSDMMGGYMSITDYYLIGNTTSNIAYYLESDNESCIKTLKVVLNINKKSDKQQAISKYKEVLEATFNSLTLDMPSALLMAIDKNKNLESDNDNFIVTLDIEKDKIDVYTMKIETRL